MFVLGTAGHVDHGKSVLVQALTGIDPDRLQEEKGRGMTIDLGFAWMKLPSGREISIIDVPGHERFVKNMLAGVGGIDLERWGRYRRAEKWMMRYGSMAIFLFALVPGLIFDLIAIAAGAVRFPFWKFVLASFAGRLPRSFLEAYLGYLILPHVFRLWQPISAA